ncbi:MAG TPA: hypothetical protein VNE39_07660 [Planctomycetota bacterium]|nr:hypothetical protein [Planctomycetota bacterium]
MSHVRRTGWVALVGVACAVGAGCAQPPRDYLEQRGADLADCFRFTIGYGLMTYSRVKFTDWIVVGMGVAGRERWGWRGRYGDRGWEKPRGGDIYIGDVGYEAGFPLVANEEGSDAAGNRVSTLGPSITRRRYASDLEPPKWGKLADRFWIGMAGTAGLSLEIGINVAELLDFVLGLWTIDITEDDTWAPKPLPAEPSGESPKAY